MRFFAVALAFVVTGVAIGCSGKSESSSGNEADAGAGGSDAGGGVAGSSAGASGASGTGTGGASGTGTGGASGASGASGSGGAPMCPETPVGLLCVRGTVDGENERLAVGDTLRIEIAPRGCFSSSCTTTIVAECSITGGGPNLTATGTFCLASTADPMVGCTADCGGGGRAYCEWDEPLEEGDYTVTLSDLSVSFTVPGTLPFASSCDGSQF